MSAWRELESGWLFEHLRDAAIVVDAGSRLIELWSPSAEDLFGYASAEMLGQPIDLVIPDVPLASVAVDPLELLGRGYGDIEIQLDVTVGRLSSDDLTILMVRGADQSAPVATQAFLDAASRELASTLEYEATLRTIARLPLGQLADVCVVQAWDQELRIEGSALASADLELAPTWHEPVSASQLARAGQVQAYEQPGPSVWASLGLHPAERELLAAGSIGSALLVQLTRRERVLGIMLLCSSQPNAFGGRTRAVAEDLGRRCGFALDNAALYRTAKHAIAARDQFLSIASHELRAPLTRMKAHAEMLLAAQSDDQLDTDRVTWSAERINAAVDRMAALTKDVLDVSRLQSGHFPFRPNTLDLVEFVAELAPRWAEHLGGEHQLVLELTDAECPVLVDEARIEQILVNLLDNAAKYSPHGGHVTLGVERVSDGVVMSVRDTGIGLRPGTHELIFEPFGRAENAERWNVPGLGLGLHICRTIVERHGGRIWAESEGDEQGACISMWLPLAEGSSVPIGDAQQRLTNQLTLAVGYCELLASHPELPEQFRLQARKAMDGATGAAATLVELAS